MADDDIAERLARALSGRMAGDTRVDFLRRVEAAWGNSEFVLERHGDRKVDLLKAEWDRRRLDALLVLHVFSVMFMGPMVACARARQDGGLEGVDWVGFGSLRLDDAWAADVRSMADDFGMLVREFGISERIVRAESVEAVIFRLWQSVRPVGGS